MFERYTEKARRVIFFARYEASQFGSPFIDTEHLLLGLLREDKALTHRFLRSRADLKYIRRQIEQSTPIREKVSTSVDLPLSEECKRVLTHAAEEAEGLSHKYIETEHLLLGLLREEKCFAAELLHERGLRLAAIREELRKVPAGAETRRAPASEAPLAEFSTDITEQASQGVLPSVVGRQTEIQRLVQVLGRRTKANAVLIGERGVGKRSIVAALAQRIANGEVAPPLAERSIVELDVASMLGSPRAALPHFFGHAVSELSSADIIYFVPELYSHLLLPPEKSWLNAAELVKSALLEGRLQCISTAAEEEARRVLEKHPWLSRCFTDIPISPPTEEEAFQILSISKTRFETHHFVTYSDDALRYAVVYSKLYVKNRVLPDKALDLLDEAGSYVRSRASGLPDEVVELRKKIRFIIKRMEAAIANHEFEKARVFSDQERSERENLEALEARLGVDRDIRIPVAREAIEEVVATWTGLPVATIRAGASNPNS